MVADCRMTLYQLQALRNVELDKVDSSVVTDLCIENSNKVEASKLWDAVMTSNK